VRACTGIEKTDSE